MGRATARALAAEGCDVALIARRSTLLDEVAGEIQSQGQARALALPADSTDDVAIRSMVDRTLEAFGRIDVVVNNTGGPPAGGFGDFDDAGWQAAYELTFLSAIRLTRYALPALRKSGRGRVVNITSSAVKEPLEGLVLSNALRPGVIGWAKTLSKEEGPNGITVNSIAPGSIDTDRLRTLYGEGPEAEEARRRDAQLVPLRRFGQPEEIAAAVAFLCSMQASYISGVTLLVDGGSAQGLLS
jgi:3-oxoacyl-[acyl-carrier protein] reductase